MGRIVRSGRYRTLLTAVAFLAALYAFFVSIDLLSSAFKLAGSDFATDLLNTTRNPFTGLLIGFLATALAQSSSSTTSIIVGLVAAGTLPLRVAIPMVMGANIGTTVTNIIVSVGHVTRRDEFRRAFAASIVHDFFNVLAVTVLLPLELLFHPIEAIAKALESAFEGVGGLHLVSPLKMIIEPASDLIAGLIAHPVPLVVLALLLLFFSLSRMVKLMRSAVIGRIEGLFDQVLFRNTGASLLFGMMLTALVQSSSATTSLVVPLAGAGILTLERIYPYTLGANMGTTVTAILAAFSTGNPVAVTVALSHFVFNAFGVMVFLPLKVLPISMARGFAEYACRSRNHIIGILVALASCVIVPLLIVLLR